MTTTLEYGLASTDAATVVDDTITIPVGAIGPIALDTWCGVGSPRRFARIVAHSADDTTDTLTVAWED